MRALVRTLWRSNGGAVRLGGWLVALLGMAVIGLPSAQAATYTAQERANMKLVADFYSALDAGDAHNDLKQKIRGIAEQYLAPDYLQHSEVARGSGAGREGFIHMFESRPAMPAPAGPPPPAPKVLVLAAQGDLVIRISARTASTPGGGSSTSYIFNLFRVAHGRLVEHWDGASAGMSQVAAAAAGLAPPAARP